MNDQADNLRMAIKKLKNASLPNAEFGSQFETQPQIHIQIPTQTQARFQPKSPPQLQPQRMIRPAKVFTVTSGKGGVGKTNISINLAIALCDMGYRVAVLDADFGLANVEVLIGAIPKYTLLDVIRNERSIADILCEGPRGVRFISGGSGVEEIIRLGNDQITSLIANIAVIDNEFDIIIIDTGAGISDTVLGMSLAADEIILVTTPEPTSITDAYALMKTVVQRDRGKLIRIIVNRADTENEAIDILGKLSQVSLKFLDLEVSKLGYIPNDSTIIKSVKKQIPFIIGFPNSQCSKNLREIARKMAEGDWLQEEKQGKGLSGFISRISKIFNMQTK